MTMAFNDEDDDDFGPDDTGWGAWQDTNGDTMFVADGQKAPVLVWVPEGDSSREQILAVFMSVDMASLFQSWLNRSFESTAMANQHLSMHVGSGQSAFAPQQTRENKGYPGLVDE